MRRTDDPIFYSQIRYAAEFPRIVRDECPVIGERNSGYENIVRPDSTAGRCKIRAHGCRSFGCRAVKRENIEGGAKFSAQSEILRSLPAAVRSKEQFRKGYGRECNLAARSCCETFHDGPPAAAQHFNCGIRVEQIAAHRSGRT